MLWCFFASDGYETADNFSKWSGLLGKFFPDNLRIEHNVATVQEFKNQVLEADLIYMHGGYTQKFLDRVKGLDLGELFKNKVVCTNSATTIALSTAAWDSEERKVVEGLGILPFKFLVHFLLWDMVLMIYMVQSIGLKQKQK